MGQAVNLENDVLRPYLGSYGMPEPLHLGARVRALRRERGLTPAQLAERLGISASYLNLIEHNRRGLSAQLLIKLADVLQLDLRALSQDGQDRTVADLMEAFGDHRPARSAVAVSELPIHALVEIEAWAYVGG